MSDSRITSFLSHHYLRLTLPDSGTSLDWALAPLVPLSHLYGLGMSVRERLYALGILQQRALSATVISIGNLTVGGTGKTPIVIALANALLQKGRRVGVVSRGYKRSTGSEVMEVSDGSFPGTRPPWSHFDPLHVKGKGSPGQTPWPLGHSAAETGDEPLLIAERCPGAPVAVGRHRHAAGRYLLDRYGIDTLVVDDGFQHLSLKRDVDILLLDATAPFGNGYVLPRGRLRERLSALARASLIMVTRARQAVDFHDVVARIARLAPRTPVCVTDFTPSLLLKIGSVETQAPTELKGERVLLLSAIGNPASFRTLIERLGSVVVDHCIFPDHHFYSAQDVQEVAAVAAKLRANRIVTTEKDAVKLRCMRQVTDHMHVWAVRVDVEWLEGETKWARLVLQN
jgi:tetraacyldisaccharide 4'-kinase